MQTITVNIPRTSSPSFTVETDGVKSPPQSLVEGDPAAPARGLGLTLCEGIIRLYGWAQAHLEVRGSGDAHAVRDGSGDGNVARRGSGFGQASREGSGNGRVLT